MKHLSLNSSRQNMPNYCSMNIPRTHRTDREDEEMMNISANTAPVNSLDVCGVQKVTV